MLKVLDLYGPVDIAGVSRGSLPLLVTAETVVGVEASGDEGSHIRRQGTVVVISGWDRITERVSCLVTSDITNRW